MDFFFFSRQDASFTVAKTQLYMISELSEQACKRSYDLRKLTDSVDRESTITVAK